MRKEVAVGSRMVYNGKALYELRADGWWTCNHRTEWQPVQLSHWNMKKSWLNIGYTIEYPKEELFDKLYLTLKQST